MRTSNAGLTRDPGVTVTLAQSEILAPVALAVANLLIAVVGRTARLFGRG